MDLLRLTRESKGAEVTGGVSIEWQYEIDIDES